MSVNSLDQQEDPTTKALRARQQLLESGEQADPQIYQDQNPTMKALANRAKQSEAVTQALKPDYQNARGERSQTPEEEDRSAVQKNVEEIRQIKEGSNLVEKVAARRSLGKSFTKHFYERAKLFGQDDSTTAALNGRAAAEKLLPLSDEERQREGDILAYIEKNQKDFDNAPDPSGLKKVLYEADYGAAKTFENIQRSIPGTERGIRNNLVTVMNKALGTHYQIETEDTDTGYLRFMNNTWVDEYYKKPTKGTLRGDTSSQLLNGLGQLTAQATIGRLAGVTGGPAVGAAAAKLAIASVSGQGTYDQIKHDAILKALGEGKHILEAQQEGEILGQAARAALMPVSAALAKFSPVTKIAENKVLADNLIMKGIVGGVGEGFEEIVEQGAQETLQYIPGVFDMKKFTYENAMQSMKNMTDAGIVGFVMGGTVGAAFGVDVDPLAQIQLAAKHGKLIDSAGKHEFRRVLRDELKLDTETADASVRLIDNLFTGIALDSKTYEEYHERTTKAYLELIASKAQRANSNGPMAMLMQGGRSAELYSEVRRKVMDERFQKAFPNGGDGEQVLAYLKNQPGVKSDELSWTETDLFLKEMKEQGKKVGVEELLKHLEESEVRVVTTMLGKDNAELEGKKRKLQEEKIAIEQSHKRGEPEDAQAIARWQELHGEINAIDQQIKQSQTNYKFVTPSGPSTNYEEWLIKVPNLKRTNKSTYVDDTGVKEPVTYRPPHFGPEARNTIVHVRLDERMVGGKKSLVVLEVQSDWHQEGRERGYKNEIKNNLHVGKDPRGDGGWAVFDEQNNILETAFSEESANRLMARWHEGRSLHQPPQGPFSKTWTALAWKKILLEASARGYETISWAPGKLQDKFQGDPGEDSRKGRAYYYDEYTPRVVKELLKGRGWKGDVEVGEVEGGRSHRDFDTSTAEVIMDHDHPGTWRLMDYDGREAGPFASEQEAKEHLETLKKTGTEVQKENVFTITLPPEVRQRILSEGFPLFQTGGKVSTDVSENFSEPRKTILLKDGRAISGKYENHIDLIRENKIDPDQIVWAGDMVKAGGKLMFSGSNTHIQFYQAEIKGGKLAPEGLKSDQHMTFVEPSKVTWLSKEASSVKQDSEINFFRDNRPYGSPTEFGQGTKASVEFLDTNHALLRGLENPDASSAVHEIGHVLRRMLPEKQLKQIEKALGVEGGFWEVKHEEQFARLFEAYVLKNRPPSGDLQGTFQVLSDQMKQVYKIVDGSPLQIDVSEDVHKFFDNLFMQERPSIEGSRNRVLDVEAKRKIFLSETGEGKRELTAGQKIELKTLDDELKVARAELQREQKLSLNYRPETRVERMKKEGEAFPVSSLSHVSDTDFGAVKWLSSFARSAASYVSQSALIPDGPWGNKFKQMWDHYFVPVRAEVEKYRYELKQVYNLLSKEDKTKLLSFDETGQAYFLRLADHKSSINPIKEADSEGLHMMLHFYAQLMGELDQKSEAAQVMRRMKSGDLINFVQSLDLRVPTMLTNDGYHAIKSGGGEIYNAVLTWLVEHNKNVNLDVLKKEMKTYSEQAKTRPFGMLEFTKNIEYWPTTVEINGRVVAVTHYDPMTLMSKIIERTVNRRHYIKTLGGGQLEDVTSRSPGFDLRMRQIAKVFDVRVSKTNEELTNELTDFFGVENKERLEKMTQKERQALAKGLTSKDYDADTLLDTLLQKIPDDIKSKGQERLLRSIANKIGGVQSKAPIADVWNEVKRRLTTEVEDDLTQKWTDAMVSEGATREDVDKILRSIQGIPNYDVDMTKPWTQFWASVADIGSTLITSQSIVKNVPQWMKIFEKHGFVDTIKGLTNSITNWHEAEQFAIMNGSAQVFQWWKRPETRFNLSLATQSVRQVVGTPMAGISHFLNVVANETARVRLADWKDGKFSKYDAVDLRALRVSEENVKMMIDTKGRGLTTELAQEVMQQTGNLTQFVLENPHRKGEIEHNPIMRRLFQFHSFYFGNARNLATAAEALRETWKTGDVKQQLGAAKYVMKWLATNLGVGFVTALVYSRFRGRPGDEKDDKWWDMVAGSFIESGGLGMPSRWLTNDTYSRGYEQVLLGNMPVVNVWGSVFGTLFGISGKEQDLPVGERAKAAGLRILPLGQTLMNWWEKENNLPRFQTKEVQNKVRAWQKVNDPKEQSGQYTVHAINPDYWKVYEPVSRYDLQESLIAGKSYLVDATNKGEFARKAAGRLRSSLLQRRPMDLNPTDMKRFLFSLNEVDRANAISLQYMYMDIVNKVAPVPAN